MRQGDVVHFLHTDHLGSTSLTTDATGVPIAQTRYLPYGEQRWTDGDTPTDFTFTGQRADGFGLLDYNARYYDNGLGRFISPDTIVPEPGNPQNFNRYSFVLNNPVKFVDPSGHCWGFASGLRNTFYSTTCNNLDMAMTIVTSPDATVGQKVGAGAYIGAEAGAHTVLVVGTSILAWEAAAAAVPSTVGTVGTGTAVAAQQGNRIAQAAQQAAARLNVQSLWNLNPFQRGVEVENIVGRSPNLAQNFPTIDRFQNGVATSIKSLDLTAATYQNLTTLDRTVTSYINTMANYQGQASQWGGVVIRANQITSRAVDLAIPATGTSQAQMNLLQTLQQQAANANVPVTLNIIPVP